MKIKMNRRYVALATALVMFSMSGCAKDAGSASQGGSQSQEAGTQETGAGDEDVIVIGSVNDLSGNRSVNGNAINNGVKLAVDQRGRWRFGKTD